MLHHAAYPDGLTRAQLVAWYRAARARTKSLFALINEDAYYDRPIPLRNPIVFYEGHLPAFSVNTLIKLAHKRRGLDEHYETLFARGIDPEDEAEVRSPAEVWPSRAEVQAYGDAADALIVDALENAPLEDDDVPELRDGEAVFTVLEHELMHQETLLYLFHNLEYEKKNSPSPDALRASTLSRGAGEGQRAAQGEGLSIDIPKGRATLGAPPRAHFGWDNEFPSVTVDVDAFTIDAHNVTNGDYLEFVDATGAKKPHFWTDDLQWRGMFALVPLPLDSPVYVTHAEAAAYARWKGKRLPTEAEYHRAAFGTPSGEERLHPWGDEPPDASRGNFDFAHWDPVTAGSYAPSAWGVHDLVGNGWEWTSSEFAGFPGFTAMPSYLPYSTDFFDGQHYVLKGGSPATARELVRRSFRNWFRPNYPFVYATFRCVDI